MAALAVVLAELLLLVVLLSVFVAAELVPGTTSVPVGPCGPHGCDLGLLLGSASGPVRGTYEENFSVDPTGTFTTADFELRVDNGGTVVAPGGSPAGCAVSQGVFPATFNVTNCGAPAHGWYAVMTAANATIESVFNDSYLWSGAPLSPSSTCQLYILSGTSLHAGNWTLTAYGRGAYAFGVGYWQL